jgi:predicted aspartyl protease
MHTAILDSGADATIIPIQYLHQVQARKIGRAQLRTTVGAPIQVDLYIVSLSISDFFQRYVEVIADTSNQEIIMGRDVLNQLIVTLNGLAAVVEISA